MSVRLQVRDVSPIFHEQTFLRLLPTRVDVEPIETGLLQKVKDSDTEAFRVLFERYQPVVFRRVLFSVRDSDMAHDIVQETFLRIWTHRRTLQPQQSFLAYAFRISGNIVRDESRRRAVREKFKDVSAKPVHQEMGNPEDALELTLLQMRLSDVIDRGLPERCRTIFILRRFEGMTNREIAALLHLSVRTVEHQMNKALKVLRKEMRTDY